MQQGGLIRSGRKRGPDVWQFRWAERGPYGKRIYRKRVIGTVYQYTDADSARKAVTGLLREISSNPLHRSSFPMTVAEVCDHFIQREPTQDNTWRSYSTKKAYKAYLKSDRWLQQAYCHHQATEGSLYSRSKCRRRQRLAWNVRALTAGTLRPSRRAVSALVSPCNSRRRTTVRKFSRRCEIA